MRGVTPSASRRESAGWGHASSGGEFDLRKAGCETAVTDGLADQVGPLGFVVALAVAVTAAPLAGEVLAASGSRPRSAHYARKQQVRVGVIPRGTRVLSQVCSCRQSQPVGSSP